jgi:hypothetical protein
MVPVVRARTERAAQAGASGERRIGIEFASGEGKNTATIALSGKGAFPGRDQAPQVDAHRACAIHWRSLPQRISG